MAPSTGGPAATNARRPVAVQERRHGAHGAGERRGWPRPPPAAAAAPRSRRPPAHPPPRRTAQATSIPHPFEAAAAHRRTARAAGAAPGRAAADAAAPARRARLEADAIKAHAEKMDWRALYEKGGAAVQAGSAAQPNMGADRAARPAASGETAAAAVETPQREFVCTSSASMVAWSAATPSPTATTVPNTPLINDRLGRPPGVTPGSGSPPTPGPTSASVTSSPAHLRAVDASLRSN